MSTRSNMCYLLGAVALLLGDHHVGLHLGQRGAQEDVGVLLVDFEQLEGPRRLVLHGAQRAVDDVVHHRAVDVDHVLDLLQRPSLPQRRLRTHGNRWNRRAHNSWLDHPSNLSEGQGVALAERGHGVGQAQRLEADAGVRARLRVARHQKVHQPAEAFDRQLLEFLQAELGALQLSNEVGSSFQVWVRAKKKEKQGQTLGNGAPPARAMTSGSCRISSTAVSTWKARQFVDFYDARPFKSSTTFSPDRPWSGCASCSWRDAGRPATSCCATRALFRAWNRVRWRTGSCCSVGSCSDTCPPPFQTHKRNANTLGPTFLAFNSASCSRYQIVWQRKKKDR